MPISVSTSQQRLIRLIAMGTTDIEIARKMALTPDQMQKAFATLCAQFNVADRVELILQIWFHLATTRAGKSPPSPA